MSGWLTTVLLLALVLAAGAAAQLLLADARPVPRGADTAPTAADDAVRRLARGLSVVVPARDEATTLPLLLASLAAQRTPPREVVVVDDGSTDGTADLARAAGATVVTVDGPAPGWTGKAWACHLGAERATGSVLLFLDADTVLAPDAVEGLLALLARHGGLVSVQPYHEVGHGHEQLSAYFNVVGVLASGMFARRRPRPPMAFGPVLLTTVEDYRVVGGHGVVRAEVLDDAALAAAYDDAGRGVRCFLGGGAVRFRMYPGGRRQLLEGWSKNIAAGAGAADRWSSAGVGLWVAGHWAVTGGAALGLGMLAAGGRLPTSVGPPLLYAVAWVAVALHLRSLLRRVGSFTWWTWALFPVPLLAFTLVFVRSALLTTVRREVMWRGRRIAVGSSGREEG